MRPACLSCLRLFVVFALLCLPSASQSVDAYATGGFTINGQVLVDWPGRGNKLGEIPGQVISVRIKNMEGRVVAIAQTSSDGRFSFEGINRGTYTISTIDPAFVPKPFPLNFNSPLQTAPHLQVMTLTRVDTSKPTGHQLTLLSNLDLQTLSARIRPTAFNELNKGLELVRNPKPRDSAESHLKKASALDSKVYELELLLGLEQERQTHRSDAIRTLERAASLNPKGGDAFIALGRMYLEDEAYARALEKFETAERLGTLNAEACFQFGLAYSSTGDFSAAADKWKQAIKLGWSTAEVYQRLYTMQMKLDQRSAALSTIEEYLSHFPGDDAALEIAGKLRLEIQPAIPAALPVVAPEAPPPLPPPEPVATPLITTPSAATEAPTPIVADSTANPVPIPVSLPEEESNVRDLPTISVNVSMVEIYASVADRKSQPVSGLRKQDFAVIEDGIPQSIEVFEPENSEINVAVLLDSTSSMAVHLPRVKTAIADLITMMNAEDPVALYAFDTRLRSVEPFSRQRDRLLSSLMQIQAKGGTALYDALAQLARDLSNRPGKKVILLFTDGMDNRSFLREDSAVAAIRQAGIPIYTVAQGDILRDANSLKKLRSLAAESNGISFEAHNPADLSSIVTKINDDLRHLYMLGYYPSSPNHADWHRVSVKVAQHPEFKVRAKEGYYSSNRQ